MAEGNTAVMNLEKWKAIVHFKDGQIIESDWYYTDIHARQFAEQFQDDENYSHYQTDFGIFKEDVDLSRETSFPRHPIHG